MFTELKIFDLDGCIIDSLHRYRTIAENGIEKIDLNYWRENEKFACRDSFLPAFYSEYLPSIDNPECLVIVATARVLNNPDKMFLSYHMPKPDFIISRPNGSSVSGGKLKVSGIRKLMNLKQFANVNKITVYEDNISYLKYICDNLECNGVYIPSKQGH